MMFDSLLSFQLPTASPTSLVGSAGVTIVIGSVIDLSGFGSGTAITNVIGNATVFGENPGVGRYRPEILVTIGTACTTATSATGNFALQYAPDNGSNAAGTYETASETGEKAVSLLTAGAVLRFDLSPAPLGTPRPRFMRLVMLVPSGTDMTAGTIASAIITPTADNNTVKQAARNYHVA